MKLLNKYKMLKAKIAKIPMQKTLLILYKKPVSSNKKTKYATKLRSIIYTIFKTQINIIFAILIIGRFAKNLRLDYFNAVDQILKYLASNENRNIMFRKKPKFCLFWYLDFN